MQPVLYVAGRRFNCWALQAPSQDDQRCGLSACD